MTNPTPEIEAAQIRVETLLEKATDKDGDICEAVAALEKEAMMAGAEYENIVSGCRSFKGVMQIFKKHSIKSTAQRVAEAELKAEMAAEEEARLKVEHDKYVEMQASKEGE